MAFPDTLDTHLHKLTLCWLSGVWEASLVGTVYSNSWMQFGWFLKLYPSYATEDQVYKYVFITDKERHLSKKLNRMTLK